MARPSYRKAHDWLKRALASRHWHGLRRRPAVSAFWMLMVAAAKARFSSFVSTRLRAELTPIAPALSGCFCLIHLSLQRLPCQARDVRNILDLSQPHFRVTIAPSTDAGHVFYHSPGIADILRLDVE